MLSDDQIIMAHYRMAFPNREALGAGNPPDLWKAEYDKVADGGLSATLIVSNNYEGGGATAVRNFPQSKVLAALLLVRGELEDGFTTDVLAPAPVPFRPLGIRVRLGM